MGDNWKYDARNDRYLFCDKDGGVIAYAAPKSVKIECSGFDVVYKRDGKVVVDWFDTLIVGAEYAQAVAEDVIEQQIQTPDLMDEIPY